MTYLLDRLLDGQVPWGQEPLHLEVNPITLGIQEVPRVLTLLLMDNKHYSNVGLLYFKSFKPKWFPLSCHSSDSQ